MLRITGNEKSLIGGLVAGTLTLVVQLQQSGQLTSKEGLLSIAAWVLTQIAVWITANTPKSVPPTVPTTVPPAVL